MQEIQSAFAVLRSQRLIRFGAVPLALDAAQFEILARLIEGAGQPISGRDLLPELADVDIHDAAALWLAVVGINRALVACAEEAGYVEHRPESGFALVLPIAKTSPRRLDVSSRQATAVLGRAESIELLAKQLPSRRFVTVVGPGGIGKTTLALATAQALQKDYFDGCCFVDLAPLSEGRLVPGAVAAALGIAATEGAIDLAAYLGTRQLLLILDSCEHLLPAVAALVESFLSDSPQVHVLATSREPLRALGEWLHRLEPMRLPARADALTAAEASGYPGIQLFVERARAGQSEFTLTDELAPGVAALCIRLDGIPLAIELAAARVPLLGLHGAAAQIEDRLLLLGAATRRKPHRHRTLEAMLDWSHDLLSVQEQLAFRRLSVFRGNFSLAVAAAVIDAGEEASEGLGEQTGLILDLVAKSLVSRVVTEGAHVFRLLDTTRAYAVAKLALDPGRPCVLKRHALAMRALLEEAETTWELMAPAEWRAKYSGWVNDIRAALEWAYSTPGEDELALELTNLAFPLADQTSLMTEYVEWTHRALEVLPRLRGRCPELEIRLRTLPVILHQREPVDGHVAIARLKEVLALAETSAKPKSQAGPLLGLWGMSFQNGDYAGALYWSGRMGEVGAAAGDPFLALHSKRTGAQASHYLGKHGLAEQRAREVLAEAGPRIPRAYFPSPVASRVSMQIVLVRVLWMRGEPRKAMELMQECLDFARTDTPLGLCHALALAAVPLALWCGDAPLAAQWNQQLRELVGIYAFRYWRPWWEAYEEALALLVGAESPDLEANANRYSSKLRDQLCSFDPRWLRAETVERVEAGVLGWCAPEVWRARGEAALSSANESEAEEGFQRALQTARQQGALAWELRAALSLSALWQSQGRAQEAHALLAEVRERFTDGFSTVDLAQADARLQAWVGQS